MRHAFVIAALVAAGLVVGAFALRSASPVEAASTNRPVSFELPFTEDQTRTIGRVPSGHVLMLHDLYSRSGAAYFEILVDGHRVGPSILEIGTSSGQTPVLNFVSGIPVPGGSQLSIHRLVGTSSPVINLYVGAILQ
ncbi:MAG: hypothetical protein HYR85_09235 [Planctomycetes bacterium]|nr:hypothetical protein [Planctomycetota bacterium]